jgi:hypothetical protein
VPYRDKKVVSVFVRFRALQMVVCVHEVPVLRITKA